jgi:hypothetical protein
MTGNRPGATDVFMSYAAPDSSIAEEPCRLCGRGCIRTILVRSREPTLLATQGVSKSAFKRIATTA